MAQQPQAGPLVFHHPHTRGRHHHHHHAGYDTTSSSSSTSSDDTSVYYLGGPRRRRRWRWPWGPQVVTLGQPALAGGPAAAAAVITQPQPRQYGYRRFHYQGGERRRGHHRHHRQHCHQDHHGHHCGRRGRSPRRCVLTRCCRWLFGDPDGRDCCDGRGGGCGDDCCGGAAGSPTRHCEDEYWGSGCSGINDNNTWAYGPNGWRNSPWRYGGPGGGGGGGYPGVEPGGTIEEIEEGRTGPTAAVAAPVAATGVLACDQDVQHNHYHLGEGGRRRSSSRRDRDRRDGFLGLMDRERDREMDRHIINQDALNAREGRTLALLDRERDRDRGGTDVLGLLGRELSRRGGLRPGGRDGGGDDGSAGGDKERAGGLRREIEALRKDLSRLTTGRGRRTLKSTGRRGEDCGTDNGRERGREASPRGRTSPAVGNNITFGSRSNTDDQGSEENEDDDDSVDDESLSSEGARTNGQEVRERGRSLRRAGTPSDSPD